MLRSKDAQVQKKVAKRRAQPHAATQLVINTFRKEIIPHNDAQRLEALDKYAVLDGYPDQFFNELAQIIARTFHSPIALISLVAKDFVEFKGNAGMEGTHRVSRGMSLCSLAILDPEPTVFEDATKDPCLLENPLVAGEFGLQFYAGAPITTREGFRIGTVCIVGKAPRQLAADEVKLLEKFADAVMKELEDRQVVRLAAAG